MRTLIEQLPANADPDPVFAAFADWSAGLILETWQVRRVLKLDVLSELDPPV